MTATPITDFQPNTIYTEETRTAPITEGECSICTTSDPATDQNPFLAHNDAAQHVFHKECITKWQESDHESSDRCPCCRTKVSEYTPAKKEITVLVPLKNMQNKIKRIPSDEALSDEDKEVRALAAPTDGFTFNLDTSSPRSLDKEDLPTTPVSEHPLTPSTEPDTTPPPSETDLSLTPSVTPLSTRPNSPLPDTPSQSNLYPRLSRAPSPNNTAPDDPSSPSQLPTHTDTSPTRADSPLPDNDNHPAPSSVPGPNNAAPNPPSQPPAPPSDVANPSDTEEVTLSETLAPSTTTLIPSSQQSPRFKGISKVVALHLLQISQYMARKTATLVQQMVSQMIAFIKEPLSTKDAAALLSAIAVAYQFDKLNPMLASAGAVYIPTLAIAKVYKQFLAKHKMMPSLELVKYAALSGGIMNQAQSWDQGRAPMHNVGLGLIPLLAACAQMKDAAVRLSSQRGN